MKLHGKQFESTALLYTVIALLFSVALLTIAESLK